jgi:uncharacterized repeat protein (TIGR03803 family)
VYRADPNGNVQVLHSFYFSRRASQINPKDGCAPRAGLVQASDGNFYGTTSRGGPKGLGTVFKMDSGGRVTILHFFNFSDGSEPEAPVIQGKDGFLYGTATGGPRSNGGEVFKIGLNANFSIVHAFAGPDGLSPETGLLQGNDGNFYGTTSTGGGSAGVMYRMDPQGNVTVLHYFQYFLSSLGGVYPRGGILQGSDGNLYGVTQAGGGSQSEGVLYAVRLGGGTTLASRRQGKLPSGTAGACNGAYDLGYSLSDGVHIYKVEGIGPRGPNQAHLFFDEAGALMEDPNLLQKLALGAWTKERILDRYNPNNGSIQVSGFLSVFSSLQGWQQAEDILAKTTVEALAAVATLGTSVDTMPTRLVAAEVERQLANPKVALAHWVRAGLGQSWSDYKQLEQLIPPAGTTEFRLTDLSEIQSLYSQANTLASVNEALGAALAPKTWQDEFSQYIASAVGEFLGQPGISSVGTLTFRNILQLEEVVAGSLQAFNAYKQSLDLALKLAASNQQVISTWAAEAAKGCSPAAASTSPVARRLHSPADRAPLGTFTTALALYSRD